MSEDEHRCAKMLNDYWESAADAPVSTRQRAVPAVKPASKPYAGPLMSRIPIVPRPIVYALVVLLVAVGGAVVFSTQTTRATNDQRTVKQTPIGAAKVDFWIRDDSRSDAAKKSIVLLGTQLELIDSKGGEPLDAAIENPAKWYRIRVVATGETGWVYSGWIDRK